MIWRDGATDKACCHQAESMAAALQVLCGSEGRMLQSLEVAKAVACYLEETPAGARGLACDINLLLSRALASLGEHAAARRLAVFGSGLVVPLEWEIAGTDEGWVIDLEKLRTSLELTFFSGVLVLIDSLSYVWDDNRGRGLLALRYTRQAVGGLLGVHEKSKRAGKLVEEVRELCERKLDQVRGDRGWIDRPHVMTLDL